jgi:hypothetical protein
VVWDDKEAVMAHTENWSVEIFVDEQEERTRAEARLHTHDDTHLRGVGFANRHPKDRDVPEIGAELAVARALSELAHELLQATADDIAGSLRRPVSLPR